MCGRFFVDEVKGIPKFFDVSAKEMESNFNVSPSQNCAIIKDEGLTSMQWGLVPSWVKDSKIKPINAKAETIREKPFFRNAFKQRRCIVPASGFYEWQGTKGDKTPFFYLSDV
ncbi:MAG: SOS response-associated peptidase [Pseudomonadota bacterium]